MTGKICVCLLNLAGGTAELILQSFPIVNKSYLKKFKSFVLLSRYTYNPHLKTIPPIIHLQIKKIDDKKVIALDGPFINFHYEDEIIEKFMNMVVKHVVDSLITLADLHQYKAKLHPEIYFKFDELKWQYLQEYGLQIDLQGVIRTPIPETFIPQKGLIYQLFEEYGYNTNPSTLHK
jgi:hypothetical protein